MRTIEELKIRAFNALRHPELIEIAKTHSPSSAFDLTLQKVLLDGCDAMEATYIAKATRWLAVIRRDHQVEFDEKHHQSAIRSDVYISDQVMMMATGSFASWLRGTKELRLQQKQWRSKKM